MITTTTTITPAAIPPINRKFIPLFSSRFSTAAFTSDVADVTCASVASVSFATFSASEIVSLRTFTLSSV